jgi:hypothetical protein
MSLCRRRFSSTVTRATPDLRKRIARGSSIFSTPFLMDLRIVAVRRPLRRERSLARE